MHLTKMHGLGNAYLFLNCMEYEYGDYPQLARKVSDPHFGVGSDGLICVLPSKKADVRMRIFNADGSEAEMCGNGIRCLGKYVWEHGLSNVEVLHVETKAGIRTLRLHIEDERVERVSVDMGVLEIKEEMTISADGRDVWVLPVSVGNPHAVIFVSDPEKVCVEAVGPQIERHPAFPEGTNVEFVSICDRTHLVMRVWERGSGATLACGTGACAAFSAAVSRGLCDNEAEVRQPGGTLTFSRIPATGTVWMSGPAVTVMECEILNLDAEVGGGK